MSQPWPDVEGTFPFGAPLRTLVQQERSAKRVFVLGVYASAVHARWVGPDGKERVKALAVASEPTIFWDGSGAAEIVAGLSVPPAAGRLESAGEKFNGPSGRSLDFAYLKPLGLTRADAWLCDLVPHACRNPSQAAALAREYEPMQARWSLPTVDLPDVPARFASPMRREEVLAELKESQAPVIVLLGDEPIRSWLRSYAPQWRALSDFGESPETYGRLHPVQIEGRRYRVLPLVHPRQADGLGTHDAGWRALHLAWRKGPAGQLNLREPASSVK
jgi:uracil-DNA glycosylase